MVNQSDNYEIEGTSSSKDMTMISIGKIIAMLKMLWAPILAHASSLIRCSSRGMCSRFLIVNASMIF